MAKGTRYDEQFKKDAVSRFRKGESAESLGKELGIHYTSVYDWDKKFKNQKGKRRMTKPQKKAIINNGVGNGEVTELKRTIIGLSADLQFWQNYTLKLIRAKESQ